MKKIHVSIYGEREGERQPGDSHYTNWNTAERTLSERNDGQWSFIVEP